MAACPVVHIAAKDALKRPTLMVNIKINNKKRLACRSCTIQRRQGSGVMRVGAACFRHSIPRYGLVMGNLQPGARTEETPSRRKLENLFARSRARSSCLDHEDLVQRRLIHHSRSLLRYEPRPGEMPMRHGHGARCRCRCAAGGGC